MEGVDGFGRDEWVEIAFNKQFPFIPVILIPGYTKSEKVFKANSRLKEVEIRAYYSQGDSISQIMHLDDYDYRPELPGNMYFPDVMQVIPMRVKDNHIQRVRFIIKDVYRGEKYDDTCLSEILFLSIFPG